MPTYEYKCTKCGHGFELFQSMSEPPRKRCPKCRGKVEKMIGTGAGIIFKGSGFYATDYRSDSYRAGAKADTSTKSTPDSSTSKSSGSSSGDKKEKA